MSLLSDVDAPRGAQDGTSFLNSAESSGHPVLRCTCRARFARLPGSWGFMMAEEGRDLPPRPSVLSNRLRSARGEDMGPLGQDLTGGGALTDTPAARSPSGTVPPAGAQPDDGPTMRESGQSPVRSSWNAFESAPSPADGPGPGPARPEASGGPLCRSACPGRFPTLMARAAALLSPRGGRRTSPNPTRSAAAPGS